MKNKQKILNGAFYATLFMVVVSLFFVFLGIAQLTFLGVIGSMVFLVLGFFTKKASLVAARFLLIIFLIDSVFWMINWLPRISSPLGVYVHLLMRFAFWWTFYQAYKAIKTDKK